MATKCVSCERHPENFFRHQKRGYFQWFFAKNVGIAKSSAIDAYGTSRTAETSRVATDYFSKAKRHLFTRARRLKSPDGDKQGLEVYFKPIYKRNGEQKDLIYEKAEFITHA